MHRTTILLPKDLKANAEAEARKQGISLGELIRRKLGKAKKPKRKVNWRNDPAFQFYLGKNKKFLPDKDGPTDVALNHDKYLAEDMEAEVQRWYATYEKK